mgnify:FL=1
MQLSVADVAIQMPPSESAHEPAAVLFPVFFVTPPEFKFLNLVGIASDMWASISAATILRWQNR